MGGDVQAGDVVADGLEQGAGLRSVDIFGTALTGRSDHQGEAVRLRIGCAAKQNRVQDAENCGVYPDAKGEGADYDQGESRGLAKLPKGEADIGPERHTSGLACLMPGCIFRNLFGTEGLGRQPPPVVFVCGNSATADSTGFPKKTNALTAKT
jgi:hypothetical protein